MVTEPTVIYDANFSDSAGTGGPRVNIDYRMQLIKQRESSAPFLSLLLHLNSEATKTHEFRVFQDRPNPKKALKSGAVAVGASANASVTWIVATGKGAYYAPGDILRPATSVPLAADETRIGRVVSVSTDTLTVKPNDPAKKMMAVADGEEIVIMGRSFAQGTTAAKAQGTVPERKSFYTQIYKHALRVTGTHANNRLYGAPERDRLRGATEIEHTTEIAKSLYVGDGVLDTTNDSDPRTTLTGLENQITSNILSYGSTLDEAEFFDFMTELHKNRYAMDGKASRRLVLASSDVVNDLHWIAMEFKREIGIITKFGLDIGQFKWASRTWDIVEDPNLSQFMPGYAFVVQPRYVKLREFRPTRLQANIQANDADYFLDQYFTELGLEVQLEELHGIIKP